MGLPPATTGLAITPFGEIIPTKCMRHSNYKGFRRPSNGCQHCNALYNYARATGVRETRAKRKSKEAV